MRGNLKFNKVEGERWYPNMNKCLGFCLLAAKLWDSFQKNSHLLTSSTFLPPSLFVIFCSRLHVPLCHLSFPRLSYFQGSCSCSSTTWRPHPHTTLPTPLRSLCYQIWAVQQRKACLDFKQSFLSICLLPVSTDREKAFESSPPTPTPSYSPLITTCSNFLRLLILFCVCFCLHPCKSLFSSSLSFRVRVAERLNAAVCLLGFFYDHRGT